MNGWTPVWRPILKSQICHGCLAHDCHYHCPGCGFPVAHNPTSCTNDSYVSWWLKQQPEELQ